jgi:DNA-binding SARP family transcriptional activator
LQDQHESNHKGDTVSPERIYRFFSLNLPFLRHIITQQRLDNAFQQPKPNQFGDFFVLLRIQLLGSFQLLDEGAVITSLHNAPRLQSLLAYLVLQPGQLHGRAHLATLLWPTSTPAQARTNLRKLLYQLRHALPQPDTYMIQAKSALGWQADADYSVDAADLQELLARIDHDPANLTLQQRAVALYRGELLPAVYDEWVLEQRRKLHREVTAVLRRQITLQQQQAAYPDAVQSAQKLLALDPFSEDAYRLLIRLHALKGDRVTAIQTYHACAEMLQREFAAAPDEETAALYKEVLENGFSMLRSPTAKPANNRAATAAAMLPAADIQPSQPEIRHNIPHALTPFIGREDELRKLDNMIANPDVRIITIVAQGGMGKTRLATEATRRQLGAHTAFPDGIFFVSLAPLQTADEITATLISVLNLPLLTATENPDQEISRLLDYLAPQKMLLVLDNFEHLLDGRSLLMQILRRAGHVKLLVTSRERLQINGEQLFYLYGLDMPRDETTAQSAIKEYGAVQLFLKTARRVQPDFALRNGDAADLLRICRLVDGMPLAIEHAASWTGTMPLAEIAAEIARDLDILHADYYDMPERHRSMQAMLEMSWRRLSVEAQNLFQELSVFRGGISRTAASAVADARPRLLTALTHKSWLTYDQELGRYNIHELQRQFGAGKLEADAARAEDVRRWHSTFFCQYLKNGEKGWYTGRQQETWTDIRREIENIRPAWRWACSAAEISLLADGLDSLCHYYLRDGHHGEGQTICQQARTGLAGLLDKQLAEEQHINLLLSRIFCWEAAFVSANDHKMVLLDRSQAALDQVSGDTRLQQAHILREQAENASRNDLAETVQNARKGLALYNDLGERWGAGQTLELLGYANILLGKPEQAAKNLHQAMSIKEQLNDLEGIAGVKLSLGMAILPLGDFGEAELLHKEALALCQQLGTLQRTRWSQINLGYTLAFGGDFTQSFAITSEGIDSDRALSLYPDSRMINAHIFAAIHLGQFDYAKNLARDSRQAAELKGERVEMGLALLFSGLLAFGEGNLSDAKRFLGRASANLDEIKHIFRSWSQSLMGLIARAEGDHPHAHNYLITALEMGSEAGFLPLLFYCLPLAALLAADQGDLERSALLYGVLLQSEHLMNSNLMAKTTVDELEVNLSTLPDATRATQVSIGREADLWSVAEDLLNELKKGRPSG